MRHRVRRAVASTVVATALVAAFVPAAGAAPIDGAEAARAATPAQARNDACPTEAAWEPYTRPAEHGTRTLSNQPIEMSDGVTLYADIVLPDADGPFPAIVTQTAYSKDVLGGSAHFVPRGYATVTVDLRGTGTSEGGWDPFSEREQLDGFEVFEWVVTQPWSNGRTGGYGASYLGLTQLFSASQQPTGLQAIFPIVPVADAYRDIVFMGGQVNVAFMPLWVTLVHALGILPNTRYADDPAGALQTALEHVLRAVDEDSTIALLVKAATGDPDIVYDGPFWQQRSPINHVGTIEVPTFITGGLNDLFQRGEPLLYEALKDQVPAKLLMGPWGHIDGSSGAGLQAAGLPAIEDIALRWFDHYLMDLDTRIACIPDVTQWNWGPEEYRTQPDWPHPDLTAVPLHLDGQALRHGPPTSAGSRLLPPVPIAGLCSRSTSQWLMGLLDGTPCATDNRLNELFEVQYTTDPLEEDLVLNGPMAARLWLEASGPEAVVVVRVTSVAPDGTSRELTNGLQVGSFRALDEDRTRTLDGWTLQPYHPYTAESVEPMPAGTPEPVDVEILPTAAVVPAGHQLRVSIGAADVPHAISPLPNLVPSVLTATSVVHGPDTPSVLVLPVVGAGDAGAPLPDGAVGSEDQATGADGAAQSTDAEVTRGGAVAATQPLPVTGGGLGVLGLVLVLLAAAVRREPRSV